MQVSLLTKCRFSSQSAAAVPRPHPDDPELQVWDQILQKLQKRKGDIKITKHWDDREDCSGELVLDGEGYTYSAGTEVRKGLKIFSASLSRQDGPQLRYHNYCPMITYHNTTLQKPLKAFKGHPYFKPIQDALFEIQNVFTKDAARRKEQLRQDQAAQAARETDARNATLRQVAQNPL